MQEKKKLTYNKFEEQEVMEWLESIGEDVDKGDSWYYQIVFLYGVITKKENLMEGIRTIHNNYLNYKPFRYVYALYESAYINDGVYLSGDAFKQKLAETKKIAEDLKDGIGRVFDLCISSSDSITDDEFINSMKGILQKERYKKFDKNILHAVRERQKGDLDKADESLMKYIYSFKDLGAKKRPTSLAQSSKFALDNYSKQSDYGFETFSERLNIVTGGGYRGETWIIGGYTSDGKTGLCKELAYEAMKAGENILFVSLEMLQEEMEQIFHARIAYDMGFPHITLNKIRRGQLSPEEFKDYKQVIEKMGEYKNLFIHQPEGRFTINDLEMEIDRLMSYVKLDMVVVDSLELIDPDMRYESVRVRIKETMRMAKRLSVQKNIWSVIPHQISRHGREAAEKRQIKYYPMSALQESSGVEQNCTVMVWIYQDDYLRDEHRAKIGVSKNRMGRLHTEGWEIGTDWEHCRLFEDGIIKGDELDRDEWYPNR